MRHHTQSASRPALTAPHWDKKPVMTRGLTVPFR
jgi:hypothetical protein